MTPQPRRWFIRGGLCLAAFLALPVVGIHPTAAQTSDVVVFAAASLKNALDDIAAQWLKDTGNKATISYAASSALARQIEQGAPADIFISADLDWMDYLQQRGLLNAGTRSNLLGNRIVLVARKDSAISAKIVPGFDLASLVGSGRLAMADTVAVPAGKYGRASLEVLGIWNSVQDKIAQAENVRAALLLVSRGEAPLGIVYQTDAAADPNVKVIDAFPENTYPAIVYPIALTANAEAQFANAFLTHLRSAAARQMFEKQGFTVIGPNRPGNS